VFFGHVLKEPLGILCRIADEIEKRSSEALVDPEDHLSNPVNSFLLVKRLTADWKKFVEDYLGLNNIFSSGEIP
jgi:hypothetical protein